ncbi:MAG: HEAT repeat domain-containing protein, partial [Roseibacillus sp.]|nr:HEAT repeat domain-containing protein [Roseibacillus sp.]
MKALPPVTRTGKRKKLTSPGALAAIPLFLGGAFTSVLADKPFQAPPFKVRDGFEISLAAAPPLLKYPMMACLDDKGHLYVAESDGRNLTTRKEIEEELPRFIRRLTDTNRDGLFDKSTIFADKMTMPEGGLWHNGALYIVSAPYLWRLEDTNGDGVADKREKIIGEMEFDGRANQHGPYLGPNGRLYFSGGHFGYQFTGTDGSKTGKSRAGGIFSCLPDGSDVRIDGQGPINPVDVVFTSSGEVLSTAAIYDSFGGRRHDALIHWFPRGLTQRLYGEPLLPQTGHRVPATIRWGQVAPAGMMRYRGTHFGNDYRDSLFACHFNSNQIRHIQLNPDGATFTAKDTQFLSSTSKDFHPADILEDADGSLLLLDTGGWLSWGCPHSKAAKPEVLGAIYRIRRTGAAPSPDPRGIMINWARQTPTSLALLLGDPRPAVRDRARSMLIAMGPKSFEALARLRLPSVTKKAAVRRRAVFAMAQIKHPDVGKELRSALLDPSAEVRQAAARSLGELRVDESIPELAIALKDEDPLLRRLAATALGRVGNPETIAPLFLSLQADSSPAFQHAVRLALIEIGDTSECLPWLKNPTPHYQATALRVMEQIDATSLRLEDVVPFLRSALPQLRNEARRIVAARRDWKEPVFELFREILSAEKQDPSSSQLTEEIMMGFSSDEEFHQMLARLLTDPSAT